MRKCGSGIFLLFSKLFKLKSNYKTTSYKEYRRNKGEIKTIQWKTASYKKEN